MLVVLFLVTTFSPQESGNSGPGVGRRGHWCGTRGQLEVYRPCSFHLTVGGLLPALSSSFPGELPPSFLGRDMPGARTAHHLMGLAQHWIYSSVILRFPAANGKTLLVLGPCWLSWQITFLWVSVSQPIKMSTVSHPHKRMCSIPRACS